MIQEKRFSGSAPKENPDAIPDQKPERFPGAHILGWTLGVLALALMVGGFVLGGWDGIRSGFGYWAFFAGSWTCFTWWDCTILSFSTGSSCAIPTFSPILPGIEGHRRPAPVRLQQKGPRPAFCVLPACQRPAGLGLHAALKRRFLWAKNAEKLLLPIENRNSQCYNIEEKRGPLKGGLSVEG